MRQISVNVKFTVNCISPTPGATLFVKSPYNPLPNPGRGVVGRTIDRCISATNVSGPAARWVYWHTAGIQSSRTCTYVRAVPRITMQRYRYIATYIRKYCKVELTQAGTRYCGELLKQHTRKLESRVTTSLAYDQYKSESRLRQSTCPAVRSCQLTSYMSKISGLPSSERCHSLLPLWKKVCSVRIWSWVACSTKVCPNLH